LLQKFACERDSSVPYLDESKPRNCFRCENLSSSDDGYICGAGFGEALTIWTGDLALICPLFEERAERSEQPEIAASVEE
jgi:hypothetical protein